MRWAGGDPNVEREGSVLQHPPKGLRLCLDKDAPPAEALLEEGGRRLARSIECTELEEGPTPAQRPPI